MGVASRGIKAGPQTPALVNSNFTTAGGHFPLNPASPVVITSATVISPGNFGIDPDDGADKILVQTSTQDVRFTLSAGSTPTATTGFILKADRDPLLIMLTPDVVLTVIEVAATALFNFQFGK